MNIIHRSIWNDQADTFVAVPENTRGAGKGVSPGTGSKGGWARFALKNLGVCLMMAYGAGIHAQPVNGVVAAGAATIGGTPTNMVITQSTPNAVINWQSFGINAGESVQFIQPNTSSVVLNRVTGASPSAILGGLSANGKVFLVNPNGILFGNGASVNVGGLVASTLNISDANFIVRNYQFSGNSTNPVQNQAQINATQGGYVALLGANVSNQGAITAQLGTVALAAGSALTMDMAGDKLLNVTVDQAAIRTLVANGGLLQADGGLVLMSTRAAGSLLDNVVNNTGVVRAQTLVTGETGTIKLLGGMQADTINLAGTLDASAPQGGNGGLIEASAAVVKIATTGAITAEAPGGVAGSLTMASKQFSVGSQATDNVRGTTLQALLVTTNVTVNTPAAGVTQTGTGVGDININEKLEWSASKNPTTLTLNASRDVLISAPITATKGNLAVCCGRDVIVSGALTTTNGSIALAAGRDLDLKAALTTTNGNVLMCAAEDVNIGAKMTLTHTTSIVPAQSLGLPLGLTLSAGFGGTGPGVDAGTVTFTPAAPPATVTNAPTTINYNPVAYTTPTDYSKNIIGLAPVQRMVVYANGGNKAFDGTTATTLSSLKGNPAGVALVAGFGSSANFSDTAVGADKPVTFAGYTLTGTNASEYALAASCCGPVVGRTTANITAPVLTLPGAPPAITPPGIASQPPATVAPVASPLIVPFGVIPQAPMALSLVVPQTSAAPIVVPSQLPPQLLVIAPENQPAIEAKLQPSPDSKTELFVPKKPYKSRFRLVKPERN